MCVVRKGGVEEEKEVGSGGGRGGSVNAPL